MNSTQQRFWNKVDKQIDGCWRWLATTGSTGYGRFYDGTRIVQAHRYSFELVKERKIATGMELDHLCRNTACVNPDHLEEVTHRENTRRGTGPTAINGRMSICKNGHAFDEKNTIIDMGNRRCRTCRNAYQLRRYYAAKPVAC